MKFRNVLALILFFSGIIGFYLKTHTENKAHFSLDYQKENALLLDELKVKDSTANFNPGSRLQKNSDPANIVTNEKKKIEEYLELKNKGLPTENQKKRMAEISKDRVLIKNSLEFFNPNNSNKWIEANYRDERINRIEFLLDVVTGEHKHASQQAEVGFLEIALADFPTQGFNFEDLKFALGDRVAIVGALSKINPMYFEVYSKNTQDPVQKKIVNIVQSKFREREKDLARQSEMLRKSHL